MSPHQQIAAVAKAMLDESMDLLDGCREICRLRHQLSKPESLDQDLLVIVGIESDLDDCPTRAAREHWQPSALAAKDRRRDDYLRTVEDRLMNACRTLSTWR